MMAPLLILIFGIKPTTAIGTDIFYAAITKTAGGWRHLKLKTVNMPLTWWMARGQRPLGDPGRLPAGRRRHHPAAQPLPGGQVPGARQLRDAHATQGRRGGNRRHYWV